MSNPAAFIADPYQQQQQQSTEITTQPYNPSQALQYDQSVQAYYGYYQNYMNPQQQYPYYAPQDYTNSYPQEQLPESSLVQPPGIAIPPATNQKNSYYPQGVVEQHQYQHSSYADSAVMGFQEQQLGANSGSFPPAALPYVGPGPIHPPRQSLPYRGRKRGGRSYRGAGRGNSAPPARPPPQMAWCEICRVDCNTLEILEQHKNGKRHKKTVQRLEELDNLHKLLTVEQNAQIPEIPIPQLLPPTPTEQNEGDSSTNGFGARGRGYKRVRSDQPIEPPLFCQMCNVRCESQVVFQTHLTGKKHNAKLVKIQGYQAIVGAALQALCPSNPNDNAPPLFELQVNQHGHNGPHLIFQAATPVTIHAHLDSDPNPEILNVVNEKKCHLETVKEEETNLVNPETDLVISETGLVNMSSDEKIEKGNSECKGNEVSHLVESLSIERFAEEVMLSDKSAPLEPGI